MTDTNETPTTTTPTRPMTPAQEKLWAELREELAAAPLPVVLHVVEVARQLAANYAATGHIDGAPAARGEAMNTIPTMTAETILEAGDMRRDDWREALESFVRAEMTTDGEHPPAGWADGLGEWIAGGDYGPGTTAGEVAAEWIALCRAADEE